MRRTRTSLPHGDRVTNGPKVLVVGLNPRRSGGHPCLSGFRGTAPSRPVVPLDKRLLLSRESNASHARQAGGRWFESSTAHFSAGLRVSAEHDHAEVVSCRGLDACPPGVREAWTREA